MADELKTSEEEIDELYEIFAYCTYEELRLKFLLERYCSCKVG